MTESYDPYANAIAERINGILKQEFKIDCYGKNIEDKKVLVADAIKKYNTLRPDRITRVFTEHQSKCTGKMKYKSEPTKKLEKRSRLLFSN